MKKVLANKGELVRENELKITDNVGFIDTFDNKGYFVYCGDSREGKDVIHAVSTEGVPSIICNYSYGKLHENKHFKPTFSVNSDVKIKEMFVFEERKDLYKWLSE